MTAVGASERGFAVWPGDDSLRLIGLLQSVAAAPLLRACRGTRRQYGELVTLQRKVEADPETFQPILEAHDALANLQLALADAAPAADGLAPAPSTLPSALSVLAGLEKELHTEMWYIYGPDWELKPGKLISRKGTWLKKSARFSWDIHELDKLYVPHGVTMPILQLGTVTDTSELQRHEWTLQHRRVWLKPAVIRALEARRGAWFIFGPHWDVVGHDVVPSGDTWLKRSCQMSGELQPFEMIYVPKDIPLRLASQPKLVEEEWEKFRHPHVSQHRKVMLAGLPLTVKQDKFDIFVGQSDSPYGH